LKKLITVVLLMCCGVCHAQYTREQYDYCFAVQNVAHIAAHGRDYQRWSPQQTLEETKKRGFYEQARKHKINVKKLINSVYFGELRWITPQNSYNVNHVCLYQFSEKHKRMKSYKPLR